MDVSQQIALIERALAQLIRQWERFFSGDLKVPPIADRERVARRLRMLSDEGAGHRSADQFRLDQLQHRFQTYAQNWERMLREREEGRSRSSQRSPRAPATPAVPPPNAGPPASVQRSVGESLYDRYVAARQKAGQTTPVDRRVFEAQIAAQQEKLQAKLGGRVHFDIVIDGDKVKLTARRAAKSEE
jgi:hypothetical protein